ncbi:hypothetical protein [Rhizobium metallidurans]|uniref:Uncharacterized protein n=1 Tax=Rhizobium metallidurans TaxID=1265931 RepID=A0A7W6CTN7_9HYPH|nr:hypothetical protein [Rhizobium metallidurans]MBB3963515.1 hypothetical protein [Rhizobium metallidurans]
MDNRTKARLANWSAQDYERKIVSAFQEEGYDIVEFDGARFARVTAIDEDGASTLAEVNLTKVAIGMARATS